MSLSLNRMLFRTLEGICTKHDGAWGDYFNAMFKPSGIVAKGNMSYELALDCPDRKCLVFMLPLKGNDPVIHESGVIAFVYKRTKSNHVFLKHVRVVDPTTLSEYRINYTEGRYIKGLNEITDRLNKTNKDLAELIKPVIAALSGSMAAST